MRGGGSRRPLAWYLPEQAGRTEWTSSELGGARLGVTIQGWIDTKSLALDTRVEILSGQWRTGVWSSGSGGGSEHLWAPALHEADMAGAGEQGDLRSPEPGPVGAF